MSELTRFLFACFLELKKIVMIIVLKEIKFLGAVLFQRYKMLSWIKNHFYNMFLLIAFLILTGCQISRTPDPVEYAYDTFGMDLPKGKQLYLAYDIWYTDPTNINPLNYHKGTIIPFGTPVDLVKADKGYIVFQGKGGIRQFTLKNDYPLTLLKDNEFFQKVFTTENPDNRFKDLDADILKDMKSGIVKVNMTRDQVLAVFGPAPKVLNPLSEITWTYYLSRDLKTIHVVFKSDKVTYIFEN